ncbi:hypothetical protein OPT61_g3998 [Boeremia exigua]|uniref:Uncharacterized protein n=1 Tax=Boeremia exigua TaxID=749465 RepID=A0ACC2IFT2_9PLEO|nr:hypothetical protein OPT61_g3998 [Boeremia exigua]
MLARGALCRLAADVPKQATYNLPKLATIVQTARAGYALPLRTLSHVSQLQRRSYATKDSTATVKKAVKAKAAADKPVKKTATAKKPAAKKAAAKKAAPKKVKKKAAPKKKPTKKPKKVLTDEEKEKKVITKLKALALTEPTWNQLAAERNEARAIEYKNWVESHTPAQIRVANNARSLIRKKMAGKKRQPTHTQPIKDERQVKGRRSSWIFFVNERQLSSDFKDMPITERVKRFAQEWKALSASEKQRFEDQAAADLRRVHREIAAQATA